MKNTRKNLILMSAAAFATALLIAGLGIYVSYHVYYSIKEDSHLSRALHIHGDLDMMHDALRGDVMAFAYTRDGRPIVNDLDGHIRRMVSRFEALRAMPLPTEISRRLDAVRPDLERYSAEAVRFLDRVRGNTPLEDDSVKAFDAQWKQLEKPLGEISDQIELLTRDVEEKSLYDLHRDLIVFIICV